MIMVETLTLFISMKSYRYNDDGVNQMKKSFSFGQINIENFFLYFDLIHLMGKIKKEEFHVIDTDKM